MRLAEIDPITGEAVLSEEFVELLRAEVRRFSGFRRFVDADEPSPPRPIDDPIDNL